MLSLFAVLGNNFRIYSGNADNRIIFADDDRGYCSRDVLRIILFFYARLSCISKVRFVIPATDNSLALFAMITASWLHGLEPVLPNTLQPEGFAVLDDEDMVNVFIESDRYLNTSAYFAGSTLNNERKPNLVDLSSEYAGFLRLIHSYGGDFTEITGKSLQRLFSGLPFSDEIKDEFITRFLPLVRTVSDPASDSAGSHPGENEISPLEADLPITGMTSGSTGCPKRVTRTLGEFLSEYLSIKDRILTYVNPAECLGVATVSNFHAYGLMFRFFFPLLSGVPVYIRMLEYQEQFIRLAGFNKKLFLVSSPGFFKRLDENTCPVEVALTMSAGGKLAAAALNKARHTFASRILEIYGSTETGVIGYRYPENGDEAWQIPDDTIIETADSCGEENDAGLRENEKYLSTGVIKVTAPHIMKGAPFIGSDVIRLVRNGDGDLCFYLKGRSDRIIKIEDNRVSLDEIEKIVTATGDLVRDCAVICYEQGGRDFIGAMIVLSEKGRKLREEMSVGRFLINLRMLLGRNMLKLAVPRRFIIVDSLPLTDSQKVAYNRIKELFYENS